MPAVLALRAMLFAALELDVCPRDPDVRCETLPNDALMSHAVFAPDPKPEDLHEAWTSTVWIGTYPAWLDVTLAFCVEPTTGRTSRIRRAHPGPGQPVAERLILMVAKWRFRPVVIDDEAVLACSQLDLRVTGWPPSAESHLVEPEPVFERPVSVTPPRAIHTPRPTSRMLHKSRIARMGNSRGINITSYCIDENGRAIDVKTRRKYQNHGYTRWWRAIYRWWPRRDSRIDRALADLVKTWRFTPLIVDGQPRKSCASVTFKLVFP